MIISVMDSSSLVQVLEKTISPDRTELETAQRFLEHGLQSNPSEFLKALSDVLANPLNNAVARMAAGLQIKNALTSKDQSAKDQCQQRWHSFPEESKTFIKNNILKSLGTETSRPSSAAQCVAFIALIELPLGNWQEVIKVLFSNIVETSNDSVQEASLEALGYICQDIDYECIISFSNNILTAIVHGMRKSSNNLHVVRAAITALLNSLEFTKANFEKENERNYLMEVVCETTLSKDTLTRVTALQCLVKIMSLYYEFMDAYMAQALFPITMEAMKSDVDEVSLQGIEFWSTVCDEEINISLIDTEAEETGQPTQSSSYSRHYAKGALQYLVPILCGKLTQQEESDDDDEWVANKAASVCLSLLVSCCGKDALPHILPFVKDNIKHSDWRFRDAALLAFGSILRSLDSSLLSPVVEPAIPTIIELMYDSSVSVRDTAAWIVGQICENAPESATNELYLKGLLEAMVQGLKSEPRVAANVCWAFVELAKASYDAVRKHSNTEPPTYCLSPYFDLLIDKLLETTTRADGSRAKLRLAAYEALMEMIKNSPLDCYTSVQKTTLIILERLNQVLAYGGQMQNNAARGEMTDLQSLLCATLQSVLMKVTPEDAPKISDQIMAALLSIFVSNSNDDGEHEEAMRAITTLIEVLGEGFVKYMDSLQPFLLNGLKNHADYQVCLATVGVVADLCRELKNAILPYCDEIITLLLQNLSDNSVHRVVKPQIISVLGDIALAIGPQYEKYLDVVLGMLVQATTTDVDRNDYDMVDYLNELRESIFNAYSGILQGMYVDKVVSSPIEAHVSYISNFISVVAVDDCNNDSVICACVALIGDLCTIFEKKIIPKLDLHPINKLLQQARKSSATKTKSYGFWVSKTLSKLSSSSSW